jgi:pyridoxal biosynthesis lyase PdxS
MWEKQSKLQAIVDILNEQSTTKQTVFGDSPQQVSIEEKRKLVDALKQFTVMGKEVYGERNLEELTENLNSIVEIASRLVTEYGDVTDKVTASRHMKLIQEALKIFKQDAEEVSMASKRMRESFEDIKFALSKYFDVR